MQGDSTPSPKREFQKFPEGIGVFLMQETRRIAITCRVCEKPTQRRSLRVQVHHPGTWNQNGKKSNEGEALEVKQSLLL